MDSITEAEINIQSTSEKETFELCIFFLSHIMFDIIFHFLEFIYICIACQSTQLSI